jgi:hypothetical protein
MKHVKVISVSLLLLTLTGCAGCALFQDEGEATWESAPEGEIAQL